MDKKGGHRNKMIEKPILTQSMLKTFCECPAKFKFSYIDLYTTKSFHFPFTVGTATHEGILSLLKTKNIDKSIDKAISTFDNARFEFEKNQPLSMEESQEFELQKTYVQSMIFNYGKFHAPFLKNMKVICIEKQVESSLPSKYKFVTKMDAVIKFEEKKYLYELKTSAYLNADTAKTNYGQTLAYFLNAQKKYKLDGIYIDIIKKPLIRQKTTESTEEFLNRLNIFYTNSENFDFNLIYPDITHLKQYKDFILITEKEILKSILKKQFKYNRYSCRAYNKDCDFKPICDYGLNPMTEMRFKLKTRPNEEISLK